jgi:hypothetical protein
MEHLEPYCIWIRGMGVSCAFGRFRAVIRPVMHANMASLVSVDACSPCQEKQQGVVGSQVGGATSESGAGGT